MKHPELSAHSSVYLDLAMTFNDLYTGALPATFPKRLRKSVSGAHLSRIKCVACASLHEEGGTFRL